MTLQDPDKIREKCAVFGVYGRKGLQAARLTYFGLYTLQHRGQESSGISATNGRQLRTHKANGLVTQVYNEDNFKELKGHMAIGHNRYSTSGGIHDSHAQPVTSRRAMHDILVLAHNGNLPIDENLSAFLKEKGFYTDGLNDSELMHQVIRYFLVKTGSLEEAIKLSFPMFKGAFSLLVMTKDKIAAVRDSYGIRPLTLGKLGGGYVFSSETCAIDTVDGKYIRDVKPGEMVVVGQDGLKSYQLGKPTPKLDIFEFVYFARPDSTLLGKSVYEVRRNMGVQLARENPIKADVVIPIPDSSIPAAIGYAATLRIPLEFGITKNRYIGRTFIMPDQHLRERGVEMKHNPIKEIIKGKNVVVIDDSIVRGTTAKKLVQMLKKNGAKKVHIISSSPPVKFPDFYGIDTPTQKNLIGANMSIPKIKKFIGADSLYFLSYKGLLKAIGVPEEELCTACFTGDYPIDIGKKRKLIKYENS
ncbi:MAG: amidophosphoribosyltransferase [Candidatus Levybacteria bacterium]|nr:amidophosphoribosyltransferase [Candidatus Levybacteria bacterium]